MIERLSTAPFTFWIHLVLLVALVIEGLRKWNTPWAKPALAVYGTVLFWYTGDYLVARRLDYAPFTPEIIEFSLLQVSVFLLAFRFFAGILSRRLCAIPLRQQKEAAAQGINLKMGEVAPSTLRNLLLLLIFGWLVIFTIGASLSPDLWMALIWPPLHYQKVPMYPLTGLGGGASFAFNALSYIHMLICALFGVVAILAKGPTRWVAIAMILLTWPYFWYDRARSKMLALLLPGLAAYILLSKQALFVRIAIVALGGIAISFWFSRVMDYRSSGGELSAFVSESSPTPMNEEDADAEKARSSRESKLGQDMLKELCWVNTLFESGRYAPNWGLRYLSELVNPIPRSIWAGKPTVGIDYSIARGFGGARTEHGVFATVSTGMIGQGCVNFGPYLGVLAAAFLFALWAAYLSRLWCQRYSPLRLGLFLIGIGLTFNTGRDFTLLVLFPFLFGYVGVRLIEWHQGRGPHTRRAKAAPLPRQPLPPAQP